MKKIISLMSGSSISYLISFFVFMLATRSFSKEEIGLYSIFLSFLAIASQFTTGKIELSIPLANENDEKKIILSAILSSFVISLFIGILSTVIMPAQYIEVLKYDNFTVISTVLSISIFLNTLFIVVNIVLIKNGKLEYFGYLLVLLSFIRMAGQLFWIFVSKSLLMFITSFSLPLIVILYLSKVPFYHILKENYVDILKSYFYIYKKYKNKIYHIMPASILNSLTVYTIPIFLAHQYSLSIVGVYMLADKIISVPLRVISTAFESSFVHKISSNYNISRKKLIIKYIFLYSLIFVIIYVAVNFFVDSIYFTKIFGESWKDINIYIGYIVMLYSLFFISSTVSKVITLSENTGIILFFDIMKFIVLIAIYLVTSIFNLNIINFLFLYVFSMNILAIYLIYKSYNFENAI